MASIMLPKPKFASPFRFDEGWAAPYLFLIIVHVLEAVMLLLLGLTIFGFSVDGLTMTGWVLLYSAMLSLIGTMSGDLDEEPDNEPFWLGYLFGGAVGGVCGFFALLVGVYGFHTIFTPLEAAQFIAKWAVAGIVFGALLGIIMMQKPHLPELKT